ncbi:hypothetical protein C6P45_002218 [Maudiozyma exigua]|uniref:PITH domain-containing protein n=1 Tax=Maudiozyma exigua TaxID=34358 RepID=A0A9P7B4L7_MAUEX|nr:hypothetical protein C6P45_002218 [Kazachstania exigua]
MSFTCEDENLGACGSYNHNHNHSHGHDHGHNHDEEAPLPTNSEQSLYAYIDNTKIKLLNTIGMTHAGRASPLNASSVFVKDQENRYKIDTWLQSDTDCQMVIHIPFTSVCKIDSLIFRCSKPKISDEFDAPKTINVYKNWRHDVNIDFNTLNSKRAKIDTTIEYPESIGIDPTSNDTINEDESSMPEYHLPKAKFNDCQSITLFFKDNWSDDEDNLVKLYYLEIRGSISGKLRKDDTVPIMSVYESAPNPLDHQKVESDKSNINIGM